MRDRTGDYNRMVHRVRLTRDTLEQAKMWQRKGYTIREIAIKLGLTRKPTEQALYWDVIA